MVHRRLGLRWGTEISKTISNARCYLRARTNYKENGLSSSCSIFETEEDITGDEGRLRVKERKKMVHSIMTFKDQRQS
jgi:hypothetical protein